MRPLHVAAAALAGLGALVAPWPADWDAVGFVAAVTRFDLARFAPHAPGYPVYVVAARLAHLVARDPVRACGLASALGGALVVAALARSAPRAPWVAPLALASPVLALASVSARSDALGLGLAAAACSVRIPAAAGALLALALGARPGYAVLVATLALLLGARWPRRARVVGAAAFAIVTAAWGAWLLAAAGGLARYVALTRAHAAGHFNDWGGSAWTQPDQARRLVDLGRSLAACFAIDATYGGALRAALWLALGAAGARSLVRSDRIRLVIAVLPYGCVAHLTQNVAAEPRHLLPLALALVALAVAGAARFAELGGRAAKALLVAAALALGAPSAHALWTQRTVEPPGVAAGRYVRRMHPDGGAILFGGRSARLAEWAGQRALPRGLMGEVDVTLERLDRLPPSVYVTDEVQMRERARGAFGQRATFCRDARVDRAGACVTVFAYRVLGR